MSGVFVNRRSSVQIRQLAPAHKTRLNFRFSGSKSSVVLSLATGNATLRTIAFVHRYPLLKSTDDKRPASRRGSREGRGVAFCDCLGDCGASSLPVATERTFSPDQTTDWKAALCIIIFVSYM